MEIVDPFIFISDLDGTLLPNQLVPPPEGCLERTVSMLYHLIDNDIPVAYCTGRSLTLALNVLDDFGFPAPTYWVCNVGTEIYYSDGTLLGEWAAHLGAEIDGDKIANILSEWPRLKLQESYRNGPYKISFTFPGKLNQAELVQIQSAVTSQVANIKLVISVEPKTDDTLLDFIATGSGKAQACHYLRERHNLDVSNVFFSGDSGNDLDALQAGFCGTLVGNALAPVKQQLRQGSGKHYISAAPYGDGIIDGLKHFKFIQE